MKKQAKGRKPQRKKAPSPVRKSTRREPPPPPVTIAPADQVVIAPPPEPQGGMIAPPGVRMRIGDGQPEHVTIAPAPERMREPGAPALDDPDRVSGFEEE